MDSAQSIHRTGQGAESAPTFHKRRDPDHKPVNHGHGWLRLEQLRPQANLRPENGRKWFFHDQGHQRVPPAFRLRFLE